MKKLFALLILLSFSFFIYNGCQQQEERTYSDIEVQQLMDKTTKLWNGGDISLVSDLYAENCVRHEADLEDENGTAEIQKFVEGVYTAYPDFKVTFDEPMKFRDRIITTFKAAATNTGPLAANMPPTGKKMSFSGIAMSKIESGKIIEEWVYYNQLPIFAQLGFKLVPVEEEVKK
jgi:steroid delta-isomerase-like uncharacterized protein